LIDKQRSPYSIWTSIPQDELDLIMTFTTTEKLQIAMLCDLAKPAQKRELDFDFIWEAVTSNDAWALDWKYPGLQLNVPTPPQVTQVMDILEMWERIEESYEGLDPAEKARVETEAYGMGVPRFVGFDGNNETELMHIARLLVNQLDRWSRYKGRDFNSHMPSIDLYSRLQTVWRPLWDRKVRQGGNYKFSADELIAILRERIHPTHRKPQSGGGWAYEPAKS
jgi:hypothetical protein